MTNDSLIDRLENFKQSCLQVGATTEAMAVGDCIEIVERYWQAYVPANTSEISEHIGMPETELAGRLALYLTNNNASGHKIATCSQLAFLAVCYLRPWLRKPEPVLSVDTVAFSEHFAEMVSAAHAPIERALELVAYGEVQDPGIIASKAMNAAYERLLRIKRNED